MGIPRSKKRAWSTVEEDVDSLESAEFDASVAAAKDTAAKSDALLSSIKEDLSDHQRWLRAQSATLKKERQRHERRIGRERHREVANKKKERVRRHRQAVRQRSISAVHRVISAVALFVASSVSLVFSKFAAGIARIAILISRGTALAASTLGSGIAIAVRAVVKAIGVTSRKTAQGARLAGSRLSASARTGAQGLSAGTSSLGSVTARLSQKTATGFGTGVSVTGRNAAAALSAAATIPPLIYSQSARLGRQVQTRLGRQVQNFTRTRLVAARKNRDDTACPSAQEGQDISATDSLVHGGEVHGSEVYGSEVYGPHLEDATPFGKSAKAAFEGEGIARKAEDAASDNGPALDAAKEASADNKARAQAVVAEKLAAAQARLRLVSGKSGSWLRTRTASAIGTVGSIFAAVPLFRSEAWASAFAWAKKERLAEAVVSAQAWIENWGRTRGLNPSQMMIIAGAVFLVFGGLLIGGGLLMRGSSPSAVAAEDQAETFSGITWLFEDPDLPLPERAVFTLSGSPEAFLINGLSISGVNNSDEPLMGFEGVLKPDVKRPDLKLQLKLDEDRNANHAEAADADIPKNSVPPHTSFRLIFPFPAEAMGDEGGIAIEDYFEAYGGLLLKLRYETEGAEKSVIQYLPAEALRAQLDEVAGGADGS